MPLGNLGSLRLVGTKNAADAVLMLSSPLIGANSQPFAQLAIHHRLPAVTWKKDRNVEIVYRFAGGEAERMRQLASELVTLTPDVIPTVAKHVLRFATQYSFRY